MTESHRLPTAKILSVQQPGEVATVALVISNEDHLTYPVAPATLYQNPGQAVFHLYQLIRRDGPVLVFETYRSEFQLPTIQGQYDFDSWWNHWAMDAVRDTSATWVRLPYPDDGEHDHCLLTWKTIAAYSEHKEGYRSSHGWVTVESFHEYIETDRLRIRSAWKSIERRPWLCPNCYKLTFYASCDEDVSADVLWDCLSCGYHATEDRRLQANCPNCGEKRTKIVLTDGRHRYSYCFGCGETHEV